MAVFLCLSMAAGDDMELCMIGGMLAAGAAGDDMEGYMIGGMLAAGDDME